VRTTRVAGDGPTVAYGIAEESARRVSLTLDTGDTVEARVGAGDLGFPVGLWAVEVPHGTTVVETEAVG
jgi:hypothetical protein